MDICRILIYTAPVKARKLLAVLLSIGYLAAAHCRVACAVSAQPNAAIEKSESDCHHEEGESKGHGSRAPCCSSHLGGDEALLPVDAPSLAPLVMVSFVAIMPSTDALPSLRLLAAARNHDPPPLVTEVFSRSSLSPRAPPAAVL